MKTVLHVGCGKETLASMPAGFQDGWKELRLDIDPRAKPDILGSLLDMASVTDASMDAVFSSHNIEHVYAHQVPVVLANFVRVIRDDGFVVVTCPDLQLVASAIVADHLEDVAYDSDGGPVTPLDIIYGHSAAIAGGSEYMAHRTGFTAKTLSKHAVNAGFATYATLRRRGDLALWLVATKRKVSGDRMREMVAAYTPGSEPAAE